MGEGEQDRGGGFSVVTLLGAIGGLCLVGAFITPLFVLDPGKAKSDEAAAMVSRYQAQLEGVRREIEAVHAGTSTAPPKIQAATHMVGPAADHVVEFIDSPSLYNLTTVARDARELTPVIALLDPKDAHLVDKARIALTAFIVFVLAIPVTGAYPVIRGVLRGFRKQSTPGLVLTFFSGLIYLSIGVILFLAVPSTARGALGPAIWLLTIGGALAVFNGIFGVSRSTWWKAYLIYAAVFAGIFYLVGELAERL
ncbi:MAG: hypothetical protein KC420_11055 [Myxococcales bacterium]|nr:hypothetical protein [Myxococcales bacterium]